MSESEARITINLPFLSVRNFKFCFRLFFPLILDTLHADFSYKKIKDIPQNICECNILSSFSSFSIKAAVLLLFAFLN